MVKIDAKTVMELRKMTGAPMMDCKAALIEAEADMEAAVGVLRKKGLKTAESKAGRDAAEGRIFSYVHHNGRIGVLVEVACETDFVARNEEFLQFGKDLSLHVAAMKPRFVSREEVDQKVLDKEREFLKILEIQKNRSMGEKAYIKACSAYLIDDWRDYMIEHLLLNNRIRRVKSGVGHRIELVDEHLPA